MHNRSFRTTWRRLEYRLNVREADLSRLEQLSSRLAERGIHVLTYSELDDTDKDEKLRALNWLLEQDVPYGEPPIELELETFKRERLLPEAVLKDAFYIAVENGRYIGMSSLWNYTTHLETEFTGVLPDYRGRGIAALMKLLGIDYARRHGFLQIRTTNDADNSAMRRLNERLGLREQSALLRLEKNLIPSAMLKP